MLITFILSVSVSFKVSAALTITAEVPRLKPALEQVLKTFRENAAEHFDFIKWEGVSIFGVKSAQALERRRIELGLSKPPSWAFGVCWPAQKIIILRLDGPLRTIEETLVHELVHLVFGTGFSRSKVPIWFSEGLAQMLERGLGAVRSRPDAALQQRGTPLSLRNLTERFPNHGARAQRAYVQAEAMTWFIRDEIGGARFNHLIKTLHQDEAPFEAVFETIVGYGLDTFESKFVDAVQVQRWWHELFRETTLFTLTGLLLVFGGIRRRRQMFTQLRQLRRKEELNGD